MRLFAIDTEPAESRARHPIPILCPVRRLLPLAAGVALFAAACDDAPEPTGPDVAATPNAALQQVAQEETPSQMAVAQAVPGFAGYFFVDGRPTAYLTDPARRPALEEALAGWLSSRGFTGSDLEIRQATYDWIQLDAWHEASWPTALGVSGAVLSDIDEANNRLRFGGVDVGARLAMAAAVAGAGVPADAFVTEIVAPRRAAYGIRYGMPVQESHTLRDEVRPVPGGYQINFINAGGIVGVSLLCTVGFNAITEGPEHEPLNSFVTNAHCSTVQGGAETPADYYQPLQDPDGDRMVNPELYIATETDDPHFSVNPDCPGIVGPEPGVLPCRWSDASRAAVDPEVPYELGHIARTLAVDPTLGTLEVDPKKSTFRIVGEQPHPVLGETANKVGRTTGWTQGEVIATCVNTIPLGGSGVLRCQADVQAGVDSGDSGSPVFASTNRRGSVGGGRVILLGILWGSSLDEGDPVFVYSPMFNIERDLGSLRTE